MKTSPLEKIRAIDEQNRRAAEVILASPELYAGLPLEWARAFVSRDANPNKTEST